MRKCNGTGDCENCNKRGSIFEYESECDEWVECDICGKRIDETWDTAYGYGNTHYCKDCLMKREDIKEYSKLMAFIINEGLFNDYLEWLEIDNAVEHGDGLSCTPEELHGYLKEYVFENMENDYLQWYVDNSDEL